MDRKHRVSMIVRILLFPFTRAPFEAEDLLLNKTLAYQKIQTGNSSQNHRLERTYKKALDRLTEQLRQEIHLDRISNVVELVEYFYPEYALGRYLQKWAPCGLEGFYLEKALQFSTRIIEIRDGLPSINLRRPSFEEENFLENSGLYKAELWGEISRVITPDFLIAANLVQNGLRDVYQLHYLPDNISLSDTLLQRIIRKGVAETHLHLSVGMSYLSVWETVTDFTALQPHNMQKQPLFRSMQENEMQEYQDLIIAGWLRIMIAFFLLHEPPAQHGSDFVRFFHQRPELETEQEILAYVLHPQEYPENLSQELLEKIAYQSDTIGHLIKNYDLDNQGDAIDLLCRLGCWSPYQRLETSAELLLLFFALRYAKENPSDSSFARAFLCYLRIKNNYFSHRVQPTDLGGLTFFRRYFHRASTSAKYNQNHTDRQKIQIAYQAAFRNQFQCRSLKKLEVKISPPFRPDPNEERLAIAKQLRQIFQAFLTVGNQTKNVETMSAPSLGIVYHFLRPDHYRTYHDKCWAYPVQDRPQDYISSIRKKGKIFLSVLEQLRGEIPYLSEYVVGLDAAGEEIYSEPWIYAPVYLSARSEKTSSVRLRSDNHQAIQDIGFTYHAGEDYHHLLSGLRHIDEVISRFSYHAGDRIGHGLALEIDVAEWIHNNAVVSLPQIEYLDNLLWLWSLCSDEAAALSSYLPQIQKEIMEIAKKIYGNTRGLSPYVLWKTYTRKFQELDFSVCDRMHQYYLHDTELRMPQANCCLPDIPEQRSFCVLTQRQESSYLQDMIWDDDKLLMTYYCPVYARHYRKPCCIYINPEALGMFQAVQSHVRKKVQDQGIFVEMNPSSNLIIGDIPGLNRYPIVSLNSPVSQENGDATALISINSDDPLIFNTNVENELAVVYHSLLYQGYSPELILQWIDKVRNYGMDSSFIRKERTPAEQENQVNEILRHLDSIINP